MIEVQGSLFRRPHKIQPALKPKSSTIRCLGPLPGRLSEGEGGGGGLTIRRHHSVLQLSCSEVPHLWIQAQKNQTLNPKPLNPKTHLGFEGALLPVPQQLFPWTAAAGEVYQHVASWGAGGVGNGEVP